MCLVDCACRPDTRPADGCRMISAGRWALIVAVAVAGADLSVPPVDQQFAVLVTGDFSGSLNGVGLSIVNGGAALISGSADGPP